MSEDLDAIFRTILKAKGYDRREAVGIYADALEAAGDDDRAWMFRQEDCPLGVTPEQLRAESRSRVVMQRIRAGEFLMGSPDHDGHAFNDEKPRHKVILTKDFELSVFPVTRNQYKWATRVYLWGSRSGSVSPDLWEKWFGAPISASAAEERSSTPRRFLGNPSHPASEVSWWDAVFFCNMFSLMESKQPYYEIVNDALQRNADSDGYRLPTEAEWEFACRAGATTIWPWGDANADLGLYAWHQANSGGNTRPVGKKRPNAWGLYDALGNVWEWCDDSRKREYLDLDAKDPVSLSGSNRVKRGGGWGDHPPGVRPAYRGRDGADVRRADLGFRIAGTCT